MTGLPGRALLEVTDLHAYYPGGIHALRGISVRIDEGEIVTLIGANGAGKSTLLNAICGLIRPRSGAITFAGQSIDGVPAHAIVRRGISQSPEGRRVFAPLTVRENLVLGAYTQARGSALEGAMADVFSLFPRLRERTDQLAGTLSGGEQQMLAIGRALMAKPRLLLLDEPSLGLSPLLVKSIFATINAINAHGTSILLVEQNARAALRLAHRGYVLEAGEVAMSGPSASLLADPRVTAAYLGGGPKLTAGSTAGQTPRASQQKPIAEVNL